MKILVIRFSSLGDVVLTTALFPNLKAFWPQVELSVLTKEAFAPVFDGNPHVDHVWIFNPERQPFAELAQELRAYNFDLVFDLQGNLRSFYLRLLTGARRVIRMRKNSLERRLLVWFKKDSRKLQKTVRERILDCLAPLEISEVNGETQLYPKKPAEILKVFSLEQDTVLVGLAPGAQHQTKQWGPEKFAEVANHLCSGQKRVAVLLGDKSDAEAAGQVVKNLRVPFRDLTGWTNLSELIAVVSRLSILVTNDSGIMHISDAFKIPTVAVFGPTVRQFGFVPYRSSSRIVEIHDMKCRPCSLHGTEKCPLKHHRCMEDITVENVLQGCREVQNPVS